MKANRSKWLSLLVILQVVFLLGLAGSYYAIEPFGQEVVLETKPIDPRDIFAGDYIALQYEISDIPINLLHGFDQNEDAQNEDAQWNNWSGSKVYVALQPDGKRYKAVGAFPSREQAESSGLVLQGRIVYQEPESVHVLYGIERYYMPEGAGREIEQANQELEVEVSIAPWGQAKINRLLNN